MRGFAAVSVLCFIASPFIGLLTDILACSSLFSSATASFIDSAWWDFSHPHTLTFLVVICASAVPVASQLANGIYVLCFCLGCSTLSHRYLSQPVCYFRLFRMRNVLFRLITWCKILRKTCPYFSMPMIQTRGSHSYSGLPNDCIAYMWYVKQHVQFLRCL